MEMTVVVATCGDREWVDLAYDRAIPSAEALGVQVVHEHAATLHDARNLGLAQVDTEWVCHLDADDELEPGFADAIALGSADLRAPAVRYVTPTRTPKARIPRVAGHWHDCHAECLRFGNWLVVGTVARTEVLNKVGGWRDFPMYEDWDLWVRCWQAGATIEAVPEAVYRAHVNPKSRNRAPSDRQKHATHQVIARLNGLPVPA